MIPKFRTVPLEGPLDLLAVLPDDRGYLWQREGFGLAGWGKALSIPVGTGPGRMARAAAELRTALASADIEDPIGRPGSGPVAFGSFTFDDTAEGSLLVIPEVVAGWDGERAWATVAGGAEVPTPSAGEPSFPPVERIRYAGSSISEIAWLEAVAKAVELIGARQLDKVVLARDLLVWSKARIDLRSVASALAKRFPECFTFSIGGLIGASPELLVRRTGSRVGSVVLAGSAPRGADPRGDAVLGAALLASAKDAEEHRLSVASVGPVLERLCTELDVDGPHLMRLANVQHLATVFAGELSGEEGALELAGALHPTAAICGVPTDPALELIRALEGFDRGRYSGPVGWTDARGDGEFAIALRCAEIRGERGRLFAGGGIVSASVPEAELEETRIKLRAMQGALEGGP